jgi:hypothetical protein
MSFARTTYDPCAYAQTLDSTVGPGAYALQRPIPEPPCFQIVPEFNASAGGHRYDKKSLVDVDSELIGITRAYSKCKSPIEPPPHDTVVIFNDCDLAYSTEAARLNNPPSTLRCNGVNRFETLCHNPQANTERPFISGTHSRIVVKDNHRPCIERPIDPSPGLPNPDLETGDPMYVLAKSKDKQFRNPPIHYMGTCDQGYLNAL